MKATANNCHRRSKACFLSIMVTIAVVFLIGNNHNNYDLWDGGRRWLLRKLGKDYADIFPNKNLVLDLIQLSNDIYDVGENGSGFTNQNYDLKLWVEADFSTECMIVTSKDEASNIVVVFRGSDEFNDWLANANMFKDDAKFVNAPSSVKLHRGFQRALFDPVLDQSSSVVDIVEKKVLELVGNDNEVILTGHSQGGSSAQITAVYLADKYPDMKVNMINFGSPRLGNHAFKLWSEDLKNLASWRFVFRNDIVPRHILDTLGFRHAGHLFQINRYGAKVYYRQRGKQGVYSKAPRSWYCEFIKNEVIAYCI